jgi:serine/threonine protein kinase
VPVETNILPPRYRGPQRIGRGGMGEIYRATDDSLGRAVAVKVLSERYAEDESVRQRFTREALAAARLSSEPNTVTIFDVGEHNDRPFIVMEYCSGGSLDDRLSKEGAQPVSQALEWLEQAARALDAAHAQGVVHRDVKPGNLLVDHEGNIHVADFGIASAAGLDSLTLTGTILGTAGYLSPEQAQGRRADAASDIYALGVVAFELLTGERPFKRDSTTAEAAAQVHAPIPSLCERAAGLPCELDPVFERVLAKNPAERYGSGVEFVDALREALASSSRTTEPIQPSRPAGPPPVPTRRARRRPVWPLIAALVLAGVAGAVVAAILTTGGGDRRAQPTTLVKTVRQQKTTVRETVTTSSSAPTAARSSSSGIQLTDRSTGLIRSGRYAEALPIAQQGLAALRGSGQRYEAYANYNVGTSLIHTGRCGEGLPYLDASEAIQGHRSEIDRDRAFCAKQPAG